MLRELVEGGVEFLLIGGVAVGYHGHVRATKDVDVVPNPERENLERLAKVLRELEAQVEGADEFEVRLKTGSRIFRSNSSVTKIS